MFRKKQVVDSIYTISGDQRIVPTLSVGVREWYLHYQLGSVDSAYTISEEKRMVPTL